MRLHEAVITTLGRKDLIAPRQNKTMRKDGARGVVTGLLGKHSQYVLVLHEGDTTPAVYLQDELQLLEDGVFWKLTYQDKGIGYFIELPTHDDVQDMVDLLEDGGVTDVLVEGPFYSDKKLTEGLIPARSLFDRLKD